ncbi:uncharacterized protein E0L32_006479 [Thyridium curvatum]|uniref:Uncharacterized protein n=1 Tax=Thyridium curvatum TaxID=1093900 RepID=A0A507AZI1_9PEZI|nr:uncharacterized protein E0L32_006479 [Thyridium curvatum]TPX13053.1 hypothetical protein E0L32_006479 [Thyridium curvatum]
MHRVQRLFHGVGRPLVSSKVATAAGRQHHQRRRGIVTEADVESARKYCVNQLRHGDYDSYLLRQFVPRSSQDCYNALRTLNLELARLPETVSNPTIGRLRMQFWRDSVSAVFAGSPPREPICILLHEALRKLAVRPGGRGSSKSIKFWLTRFINTREQYMDNRPFASLAALEEYAENTYSTLMYMTLASMPLRSVHTDHLASHIGKACGIVAVLRGIPVLSAPAPPIQSPAGSSTGRSQALLLPLDVMAETGVREEDVFRHGPDAEGLQDAVFNVATRANDHIITAQEMLKNLKAGASPGHDFEHEGEEEHVYPAKDFGGGDSTEADLRRGFGMLLEAVPARDFLSRLEAANFDPFRVKASWKLPWSLWRSLKTQQI